MRIDDGCAKYGGPTHGGADEVKVNRVTPENAFLAEVGETSVTDAALAVSVVHGVAAGTVGIGALDDYVSG